MSTRLSNSTASITKQVVQRYHQAWKTSDLDAVMALYHPHVEYSDFFQNKVFHFEQLREYVRSSMPLAPQEVLEHTDRIRFDDDTAFIQYRITLRGGPGLVSFRSSEAITVRDGLIWRVNEYASLIHEQHDGQHESDGRPATSRLGLSARQLGILALDLQEYFAKKQPYLDPGLNLQQVASETGYSRNQISYLLNQVLGQSFYRYVNHERLKHLLQSVEQLQQSAKVDDLVFAAGFNSLSAFYKCFRLHIGITPKAYLKLPVAEQNALRASAHDNSE
ncbi:AraC family transcriptional regulator [Pseudomonas sp. RL_15y_Pfl2_60]|uniref:AraC family transcriptional regulator n=1 Tax=Pseudomonas sp. RL_15y_Pfl2_60 TaxID=3088709 RepID=UPI0030DA2D4C